MPLTQLIGIAGLSVLVLGFIISILINRLPSRVDSARFIFAGTVNDADCSILLSDGHCVIIDTGEETDSEHIVSLLKENGVETIDYIILTHPDKDHIGGAGKILDSFQVLSVITPYYGQYSSVYTSLTKKIDELDIERIVLTDTKQYKCGDLKLTVYPPEESFYDDDNEYSLVTLVNHGKVNLLFAGDICKTRISEIEDIVFPEISILKVPYHGRSSNASADFIRRISPQYAIINAANAESKIEKTLNKLGCESFCTVGSDWSFTSDGTYVTPEA